MNMVDYSNKSKNSKTRLVKKDDDGKGSPPTRSPQNKSKVFGLSSFMLITYLIVSGAVLWIAVNNAITTGNSEQLLSIFLMAVLNISLILVFELLAIKKIQLPLAKLTSAAEHMVRGNYDASFDIGGDDEIMRLAETFNELRTIMKVSSTSMEGYIKELQGRVDELNFLNELNNATIEFDNSHDVFNRITEKICRLLSGDACCIALRTKDDLIQIKSTCGFSDEEMIKITKTIIENDSDYSICPAMASNSVIHIDDTENAVDDKTKGILSMINARSMIAAPLKIDGQIIGSITVWYRGNYDLNETVANRFKLFADQVSVYMKSVRLVHNMKYMSLEVVRAFANSIDARDSYTANHSDRVSRFAVAIAQELEMSAYDTEIIEYAGLLHDLGKIGIKEEILNKPGVLTAHEKDIMKRHVLLSAKIIEPIEFLTDAIPTILYHHEWYNGKGYPDGLAGDEIPMGARILSVADSFEAMTSNRVYNNEMTIDEATKRLIAGSSEQFDPQVVDAMIRVLSRIEAIDMLDTIDSKDSSEEDTAAGLDPAV